LTTTVARGRPGVWLFALGAVCLVGACAPDSGRDAVDTALAASATSLPPSPRWAYMLQNDVAVEIEGTDFNVVVMDYTKDGTDDPAQRYTAAEMNALRDGGETRVALAYLSIGEAEEYRYYFDPRWTDEAAEGGPDRDAPSWLGKANADWEGNYRVQYWSEAWQQIVLGYVDKIIACGFDGAYLDIVDGFEYWGDEENGEGCRLSEAEAAGRMIDFVKIIAAYVRAKDGDFIIIPQNGERILDYDATGEYLGAIDGIGVEDLYYNEIAAIDAAETAERVRYLDEVLAAGKPVIVVDYVYAGSRDAVVDDFRARATAAGYFPYAARIDRELDGLVTFAGQGE
jgi:cysteinyl-tRNA synthetase